MNFQMSPRAKHPQTSLGGRIFFLIWGLFFIGIPGVILVGLLYSAYRDLRPYFCERTRCVIEKSGVTELAGSEQSYAPVVVYRFPCGAKMCKGRQIGTNSLFASSGKVNRYDDAHKVVAPYPAGSEHECFAYTSPPGESVLTRTFPW